MSDVKNPLRLRKKHGNGTAIDVTTADGGNLVAAQSVRNALIAAAIIIIIFSVFWISLSELTNRVYPWFTVILGFLLGHGIRLAGRGTDWRFPVIAAASAVIGSLVANIAVAASVTAQGFGIATIEVLSAVTSMTWPVFFNEVVTSADILFAFISACLAAFYANRRLTRKQYHALRLWREMKQED
jgi:hypothetical protein